MELNDEAAGSHCEADAATAVGVDSMIDGDNKTTETAADADAVAAIVENGDAATAACAIMAAVSETDQTRLIGDHATAARNDDDISELEVLVRIEQVGREVEEDEEDDDKAEAAAVVVTVEATTATTTTTSVSFPFGHRIPRHNPLMPPPEERMSGPPVITPCVNLQAVRREFGCLPWTHYVDGKWFYFGQGDSLTQATVDDPGIIVAVSASSESTPTRRYSRSQPIITHLRQYDPSNPSAIINIIPNFSNPDDWDFSYYENRLKTYRNDWILTYLTPRQMAKAGFFFLGRQDAVRCGFCSKEFDYWLRDEDPYERHKSESPDCRFVNQELTYDVCGIFESLPGHHVPENEVNMIHNFLKTVGIVQQVKVLQHNKTLTAYESRYRTFDNCPIRINSNINTLCKAGYYATGKDDETICFCCNQGLKEWEAHDDPWVEHARWSPTCSFVLLSKGKHFVEGVGGEVNHNLDVNMEVLCKLITVHKNTSIQNNNTAHSSTERRLAYSNMTDHRIVKRMVPDFNFYISEQHPNTLPDSMLCKICFKEKLEVLFMPCGHIISCIQCAVTINECAVCRLPFDISLRVYIYPTDKVLPDYDIMLCEENFDASVETVLCKGCHKEDIELVFLPCRHACTCFNCGHKMEECPVCFEKVYAFIKVFL